MRFLDESIKLNTATQRFTLQIRKQAAIITDAVINAFARMHVASRLNGEMKVAKPQAIGTFNVPSYFLCAILLLSIHSALAEPPSTASTDDINTLLVAEQYDDAEDKAMLLLEHAIQQKNVSPDFFFNLGVRFQNASRFEVSKALLNASLERYTSDGKLTKMASALLHLAIAERQLTRYTSALSLVRRAMSIAQIERDQALKANLQLELGIINKAQGNIEIALEPLKEALNFFRDTNDLNKTSSCLLSIGDIYALLNQTRLAQTYYQDAFDAVEPLNDKRLLGIIKTRMGALLLKSGNNDAAVSSISAGLELLLAANDVSAIAEARLMMGKALVEKADIVEGRALLEQAMSFANSSGQAKLVRESRLALAEAYMKEQNFKEALFHARIGTVDARKSRNLREQLRFLSVQLSAYVALGEFKKALDIQSVIQQLREAMLDSQNKTAIEGLQAEIELVRQSRTLEKLQESKQLALAQAERKRLQTTLFWSISLATVLLMFLVWSRYKQRQQTIILRREVRQQTLSLQEKNSELKQAYKTLEEMSLRDTLTGLYNRHYLESHLPGELKRSQFAAMQGGSEQKQDLLCLLIDIDHFKRINDDYGHMAGDKVLAGFARILRNVFRQTDLIIRWGGEEFLVVCRHSHREELPELAERCRTMVASSTFDIGLNDPISVTCSVGFSLLPPSSNGCENFDEVWNNTFAVVDYALYAAKLSGRNGWIGVVETYDTHSENRTELDDKFNFASSRIVTSFNNIASIRWPESPEE